MNKQTEALEIARNFISAEWGFGGTTDIEPSKLVRILEEALAEDSSGTEQPAQQLTELQKDAANLLFALHDAWPYVHQWCSIESRKQTIVHLMRKHGDFADLYAAQQQEPVGEVFINTGNGVLFAPMKDVRWVGGKMPPEGTKLYTSPQPIKPWVGLTTEDRKQLLHDHHPDIDPVAFFDAIEAKLREKNA